MFYFKEKRRQNKRSILIFSFFSISMALGQACLPEKYHSGFIIHPLAVVTDLLIITFLCKFVYKSIKLRKGLIEISLVSIVINIFGLWFWYIRIPEWIYSSLMLILYLYTLFFIMSSGTYERRDADNPDYGFMRSDSDRGDMHLHESQARNKKA